MYYEGFATRNPTTQSSVGLARSPDGVNWFKYSGNPVVAPQGRGPHRPAQRDL